MGMTLQFITADAQSLVSLFTAEFATDPENEDTFDAFLDQLSRYPVADFSFHLLIPEDVDSLCQILRLYNALVPPTFNEVLVKQLWKNEDQSLTLIAGSFVAAVAEMSNGTVEKAASDWAATFPYQEPLEQTPAYQAVLRLRKVVEHALQQKQSLIFRLWGEPAFFRWE